MASLQIRELPDDVYQALSLKAEQEGRSLAQQAIAELRKLPAAQARKLRLETLERIRADLSNRPGRNLTFDSTALIREDRDR